MRDGHVRVALRQRLEDEHAPDRQDTLLVDELGLCGQVRVDVAVVNGSLSGYELKSASDTLKRLPTQVELYSRVLDFSTLVVAENHVSKAVTLLPDWWGVVEACWHEGAVTLRDHRPAQQNPSVDALAVAQLMWREEVLAALAERGMDSGLRSKPRAAMWERLADGVDLDELRWIVRSSLKARTGWRSAR